jgi:pyrimidine operon attenuation protein/uracil phosphoribosyltransferase
VTHADLPAAGGASAGAPKPRSILDDTGIRRAMMRIAHEIVERNEDPSSLYLVAIPNGGVPLARLLAANLHEVADVEVVVGVLDTTLYRDDLIARGERPALRRTEMPSAVDDRVVILVDDVVKTGRTIRAAMDALMDFGRPRKVQLVGLVDRGHRELPIKLDYVGKNVPTHARETVRLQGADEGLEPPLEVVILTPEGGGES